MNPAERYQSAVQLLKAVRLSDVDPQLLTLIDSISEVRSLLEVKRMLLETYKYDLSVMANRGNHLCKMHLMHFQTTCAGNFFYLTRS